jgi:NAD(P)-dependent dehydrogenase (short-subunit alcohol dehydrogenase family)
MSSVIVTGAGSGIGAATCKRLAAQGIDLVIHTGTQRASAEAVAAACAAVRTRVVVGDMAQPSTIEALIDAADSLGSLRGVVANAGFADKRGIAELSDADFERALQTMVVSLAHLMRASLPRLRQSGQGRFVALSSFVAHRFRAGASTFPSTAAAKAGIEALVRAAAAEEAAHGVTVNAIAPGYVRKDKAGSGTLSAAQWDAVVARVPAGRLAAPDDIAGPIVFLLGPDAGFITGQVLHVDGGLTL